MCWRNLAAEVPPWRVVAGNCAELCLCRLRHQPGAENLRPLGAGGALRADPQRVIPRWEVSGRFFNCLAVLGPEKP